jgi:hypothetical protein
MERGTVPGDPADHLRALLAVLLPFARDAIGEHGDVYPFGGTMLPDGELQAAETWGGDGVPIAQDVLDAVRAGLRERAARGELLATGVVAGVAIEGDATYDLAIRVELEHRDAEPVTWIVPYRSDDERYEEGTPFTVESERHTWPA